MSKPETNVDDTQPVSGVDSSAVPEAEKEPEEEIKKLKFSYVEPFAGIFFALLCTIVFLVFPQIITVVFIGGYVIPTFDEEVIRTLWVIIPGIIWGLLHIGKECFYLYERRYTQRLAIISIVAHVLAAICACIIFIPYKIVFWEYIDWVHDYWSPINSTFETILSYPNLIVLFIMLIVSLIESINLLRKASKSKDHEDEDDKKDTDGVVQADQAEQTDPANQTE